MSGTVEVLSLELVGNLDIQVSPVLGIGLDIKLDGNFLICVDGKDILEVENGLLPVGVLGVRTGGEADGLVACSELDVEP